MAFESRHSLGVPGGEAAEGTINAPLRPPVAYTDYKEGGTYSFLIDHQGFRIIVHASSYFNPGMYDGIEADVVFLGIATLGKKSRDFVSRYWDEVVTRTKARLVVPIHWDDFTLALDDRPLRPAPYPLEDFPRAMDMLRSLAGDRVAIRFMPLYAPVDIEAAAGPPLRARPKPRPAPAPSSCPNSCPERTAPRRRPPACPAPPPTPGRCRRDSCDRTARPPARRRQTAPGSAGRRCSRPRPRW